MYAIFFFDFLCFDVSLLFVTVTLQGVSNKHCLLSLFSFQFSLLSPEKARQSSACWNGALNLPSQKLATAVMAVESFLCYHAAHWTGELLHLTIKVLIFGHPKCLL